MRSAISVLTLILLTQPAAAQSRPRHLSSDYLFAPGSVAVTLYATGAAFSDFQRGTAQPVDGEASFSRRVSATTTAGVAAELMTWFTTRLGLRVQAAWLPSRFDVKYDPAGAEYARRHGGSEAPEWTRLDFWTLDAAALIRPPLTLGRVAPYGILGGGVATFHAHSAGVVPPEARAAFAGQERTAWAVVAGLGAVVPLERQRMLLAFALTSHLTPTPLNDQGGGEVFRDGDLDIRMADPAETGSDGVSLTSNVRLMVGLTIPLGRIGG